MNPRSIKLFAAAAAVAFLPAGVSAQRQPPPTPEQRLERLERQLQQVQRQVFPRGRPADTAGTALEPAATQSSVVSLDQRLDSLERQLADILRLSEENGNRLRSLEFDLGRLRSEQEQRIQALEQKIAEAAAAAPVPQPAADTPGPAATRPKPAAGAPKPTPPSGGPAPAGSAPATDAGEAAYTEGFKLWEAGQLDDAIASLRGFTAAYPKHRRVSYANNLIGRAQLDKGDAQSAAQTLLANYRGNPKGERAPDSLFYLGQALMKLGQPGQACRAYEELEAVYGARIRADLRKQVDAAKAQAQCS